MATLKVPQPSGEITITRNAESKTYHVKDHETHVKDSEVDVFLRSVAGSHEVKAKPATTAKEGTK